MRAKILLRKRKMVIPGMGPYPMEFEFGILATFHLFFLWVQDF